MTVQTYAIVDNSGNILNIIMWDGMTNLGLSQGQTTQASPATDGSIAQAGGTFNGTSFVAMIHTASQSFNGTYYKITITNDADLANITQANSVIELNKTTGSPTSLVLPTMTPMVPYYVDDVKGDANVNPSTITTTQGDGKINGQASYVNSVAGANIAFIFDRTTTITN